MKNIRFFLSENFQFLDVKFSIYLNSRVFVMYNIDATSGCCIVIDATLSKRCVPDGKKR